MGENPRPLLKDVLRPFAPGEIATIPSGLLERPVTSVTANSRDVKPGSIFVAIRGTNQDGHAFVPEALRNGATLIVGESPPPAAVPFLRVADARVALAQLAATYYQFPSLGLVVLGVTGTSGKTTTTYLIESILNAAGIPTGVIGTVNIRYGNRIFPAEQTTPDAAEIQRLLSEMKAAGCGAVVMEVSSHALRQNRTAYVAFDAAVFTNLSPEHQDFHPDMEHYFKSKEFLFTQSIQQSITMGKKPFCVVNHDDPYGRRLQPEVRCLPFELEAHGLEITLDGIRGTANGIKIHSPLTGTFNASNILAAVHVGVGLGLKPQDISAGVTHLQIVPGRLERVANSKGIHVFVDYAHKPDALQKVLETLRNAIRQRNHARLITVFGCGGDRDRKKRPVMGKIAVELSDRVLITSDNPRTENPDSIIQEIVAGITAGTDRACTVTVEPDRKKAIQSAIREAHMGDVVLIAGKGHEDYQIISAPGGTRKIHFDDREVAAEALNSSSSS